LELANPATSVRIVNNLAPLWTAPDPAWLKRLPIVGNFIELPSSGRLYLPNIGQTEP
jgi:hypothetical protein